MEKTWQMRLKDQKWGVTFIVSRGRWNIWNMYQPLVCFFPSGFPVSVKLGVSVQDGHSSLAWWAVTKTLAISFRGWHPTDPTQLWKFYSAVIRIPKKNQPGFNVMSGKGFEGCSSRGFFSDHDMPTCKAHQAKLGNGGRRMGDMCFGGHSRSRGFLANQREGNFRKKSLQFVPFFDLLFQHPEILGFVELFQTFWKKVYKWAN